MEPGRTFFDLGGLVFDLREFPGISVDVVPKKTLRKHVLPAFTI
jgi:hypothetical protein